jgi:protein O-GlcNAc transferase
LAFLTRISKALNSSATVQEHTEIGSGLLQQAEALEAEGRLDEALRCYDQAIISTPGLAVAYFRKGNILLDGGHYQQAADAYAAALQFKPDSAGAQLNMGRAQQALGHLDAATAHYQQALEINPKLLAAWLALGDLQSSREQWTDAEASFSNAAKVAPADAQIVFKHSLLLHQLEQFALAEIGYKRVLTLEPHHGDALHNLGALALRAGQAQEAANYFERALAQQPDNAETLSGLGSAQLRLKQFEAAAATFRRALGSQPDHIDAHIGLCGALRELNALGDALACITRATSLAPSNAIACLEHGLTLYTLEQFPAAENWYRKALLLSPNDANAYNNLGAVKRKLNETEAAAGCFQRAIDIDPDFAQAHLNLGNAYQTMGRHTEAMTCYEKAIALAPDMAEAHLSLGSLYQELGQLNAAEPRYLRAIELNPDLAQTHSNLGAILSLTRRYEEAMRCFARALALKADSADTLVNRSNVLKDTGRIEEAIAVLNRALELDPQCMVAHNNLLFNQHYLAQRPAKHMLGDARRFGAIASALANPYQRWDGSADPTRKLRIGFVSGDLLNHPVGHFLEGVLKALHTQAKERLEVVCYPTRLCNDALSQRLQDYVKEWTNAFGMSDEALASRIHNDRIDVLFDLSGHTGKNRLPMFAWKPAPVQVSWLGYFATTGLPAMDYFLADPWTMTAAEEAFFTEKVWRLPETRLCFTPPDAPVDVGPLPALSKGYVTFACFNNLSKITDKVLDTWAQILLRVPTSKLFIKSQLIGEAASRSKVIGWFTSRGITQDRLILEDYGSRQAYLEVHNQVDLALDPFPFPGGTTTAESLWMGVPVLTLEGEHFLARQGVGLLGNAGLADWIACDVSDYIEKAVAHASDLQALASLRCRLRQQVVTSPLFDAPRFARHFEAAIRDMWRVWCESPAKVTISGPSAS